MDLSKIGFDSVYERLSYHINDFWKGAQIDKFKWDLGRIRDDLPNFSVIRVSPVEPNSPWVYLTQGAWEVDSGKDYRLEFFLVSPFETPRHIETLAMLASFYSENKDLDIGSCLNVGRGWLENSKLDHLLVSLPYPYGPELENCSVNSNLKVRYLWLLPINSDEKMYLDKNGMEALEQKFDVMGINYLDPFRKPVTAQKKVRTSNR